LFAQSCADAIKTVGMENAEYLVLKAPYIDFIYSACDDALVPKLKKLVCAALARREQFRRTKPPWAPDLPTSLDACEKLQTSCSTRMQKLGDYGYSLLLAQWDPTHPSFADWLAAGRRGHSDETLEAFEQLTDRIDAGVQHRGRIA
jgi:hypothetical protein